MSGLEGKQTRLSRHHWPVRMYPRPHWRKLSTRSIQMDEKEDQNNFSQPPKRGRWWGTWAIRPWCLISRA
eukprot:9542-Eustigmatos_ZCMA.PRE.1